MKEQLMKQIMTNVKKSAVCPRKCAFVEAK